MLHQGILSSLNAAGRRDHHCWYNQDWVRYTQSDPVGMAGGINLYRYVRNNPLLSVDPLGLFESGDVIWRCCANGCDVVTVFNDPTPSNDCDNYGGSAPDVFGFGPSDSCDECEGTAEVVQLNGPADPYGGCYILGKVPGSGASQAELMNRFQNDWRIDEGNPPWGYGPDEALCYDLSNTLAGLSSRYFNPSDPANLFPPRDLRWWRDQAEPLQCMIPAH